MMTTPARADLRRRELVAQLVGLFLREGFGSFSMADLAERLRCSKSTLYLVAASKDQIVAVAVRSFFKQAAERIEALVAASDDPVARLRVYLEGVAGELEPASEAFYADLLAHPPANEVYQDNTLYAAGRVRDLVAEGVTAGVLRPAHAAFVGAAVAHLMTAIQRGDIAAMTGLSAAEAYRQLADLILSGLGTGQPPR